MVFLDKTWFTPVGRVLDQRDASIRYKLGSVKDITMDVDTLAEEAQGILRAARREVTTSVNAQKGAKQSELDAIYNQAKAKVNSEVEAAIAALQMESDSTLAKLDAKVDSVADEVLARVLPDGIKL
eukprot:gene10868-16988_t